jgi:hypothetical protein
MGPQLEEQEPTFAFHYWWNANISTQISRPGWLGPAHSYTYSSHKEAHCNVPTTGAQIPGDGTAKPRCSGLSARGHRACRWTTP